MRVVLSVTDQEGRSFWAIGSGILLAVDGEVGYVLTNSHVAVPHPRDAVDSVEVEIPSADGLIVVPGAVLDRPRVRT
ncbi:hypothetical protein BJF90_06290 [Pseudonocardia sp. CNS-004]|nr:hypothetical protein BJF90_06290 [Pseudonocardia sp. CNS-004]